MEEKKQCLKLFSEYSAEKWKKCCNHVYKIEEEYWVKDAVIEETIDSIIISLGGESSNSESTSSEDNASNDSEDDCDGIRMLD